MSTTMQRPVARVDGSVAHDVCAAFLGASSAPKHPTVMAAYRELERQSDEVFRVLESRTGAVHDIVGHVIPRFGFDRDGEFAAWKLQERLHRGLARWALATELHAEHSVRWTTGSLSDHKAMLLDGKLLQRARRGVCTSAPA